MLSTLAGCGSVVVVVGEAFVDTVSRIGGSGFTEVFCSTIGVSVVAAVVLIVVGAGVAGVLTALVVAL